MFQNRIIAEGIGEVYQVAASGDSTSEEKELMQERLESNRNQSRNEGGRIRVGMEKVEEDQDNCQRRKSELAIGTSFEKCDAGDINTRKRLGSSEQQLCPFNLHCILIGNQDIQSEKTCCQAESPE